MITISTALAKRLTATVAAGAMVLGSASPAFARHDRDSLNAGEIIAGALIIGGIAAVIGSSGNDRDRDYRDDGRYDDDRYGARDGGRGNARSAVEMCVNAAERSANRYSYGRSANVTDIRDVQRSRDGFTVKGRIAVNSRGRSWSSGDARYGSGWGGDYRGYNDRMRGYDSGRFTCKVRNGRVVDVDIGGLRGR